MDSDVEVKVYLKAHIFPIQSFCYTFIGFYMRMIRCSVTMKNHHSLKNSVCEGIPEILHIVKDRESGQVVCNECIT